MLGRDATAARLAAAPPAGLGAPGVSQCATGGGGQGPGRAEPGSADRYGTLCGAPPDVARDRIGGRLVVDDGDLWLAADSQWAGARGVGRRRARALPKWDDLARSRDHARRQSARAPDDRPARMELAAVPADERVKSVVSRAVQSEPPPPAHRHCRTCAEIADCVVAVSGNRDHP